MKGATETARHVKKSLKIARYLGVSPYKWSEEKYVEFTGYSSLRYCFFIAQMTFYLTYESFIVFQWVWLSFFDPNVTTKEKSALQYVAFAYSIPVILHLCSFFNADQLHHFISRLLLYQQGTCSKIARAENLKQRQVGPFIRGVMSVGIAVMSLNTASLFLRPAAPHLLTSLIPGVTAIQKWKLIPIALLQCYLWSTQWAAIYLYSTVFIAHICTAQNALEILKMTDTMTPERFCKEKRTLQVLQCNFNALMRWVLWTSEVILITIVVFGICGSVWAEGYQRLRLLVVAFFCVGLLTTCWSGFGGVYENSVEVLAKRKQTVRLPLHVRKFLRATRPIRVEIGGYFYVDRAMTLTIMGIVTENTFNVLLATGV